MQFACSLRIVAGTSGVTSRTIVFFTAVVQTERAEHLIAAGRADEARDVLAEAREAFVRLRAAPWIARVDASAQRAPAVA